MRNSTHFQYLFTKLQEILHNESYNGTEIENLIKFLSMENSTRPFYDHKNANLSRQVDCGCFENAAEVYAHNYHPYFAIAICIFGTVANVFNIVVLTKKEMACAPINRILTALAVADMLLMIEYIPYASYYFFILPEKLDFPYTGAVYMLFHAHFTQILHTTSIFMTLTLAIWRYLAIGYPEKNHILCTQSRCTLAIVLSYALPVLLCAPTYLTMTIKSQRIYEDKMYILYHVGLSDLIRNDPTFLKINFWFYAVIIKLLPCFILTIITLWLIRTLFQAKKRKQILREFDSYQVAGGDSVKATKSERRADRTTKMLIAVLFLFLVTEFPQGIFSLVIGLKGKRVYQKCYQLYGEVLDMLALINGAINFILYCYMNRMFRATFGLLFRKKILGHMGSGPPSDIHTTYV